MGGVDHSPVWFQQVVEHSVLRNRALRNFLKQYKDEDWPEVTSRSQAPAHAARLDLNAASRIGWGETEAMNSMR